MAQKIKALFRKCKLEFGFENSYKFWVGICPHLIPVLIRKRKTGIPGKSRLARLAILVNYRYN